MNKANTIKYSLLFMPFLNKHFDEVLLPFAPHLSLCWSVGLFVGPSVCNNFTFKAGVCTSMLISDNLFFSSA